MPYKLEQSLNYGHHVKGGGLKSLAVVGITNVTDSHVYGDGGARLL